MSPPISFNVATNRQEFLNAYRLGIDFGDKAHGLAVVKGQEVLLGVTAIDASESDLENRNKLRRGRRTRESRRQRLARLRQWCLRNRLPDPDPYFNKEELAKILWPPDTDGRPQSAFGRLTPEQRLACRKALLAEAMWQQFLGFPPEVVNQCAIVNPFIARRLAREGRASPLIFVRAIWHLFEHRGFDWYNRMRGENENWLADKGALLRHLKTLVISTDEELEQWKKDIGKRDEEAAKESSRARRWLDDPKVEEELRCARVRGKQFPISRRLNPPRHYVEKELQTCLASLPLSSFDEQFGRKNGQAPLTEDQQRKAVFEALKKLLNWNRREPRFDNRQLRGCTWCAAQGIWRNTPRNKNVLDWHIKAAIRDIKVSAGESPNKAEASATKRRESARGLKQTITAATRWLGEKEFQQVWELVTNLSLNREELREKLDEFFKVYAKLPKRVFVREGQQVMKQRKLVDPYKWHREELLNLAEGWHRQRAGDKQYRQAKGRARLCVHCLQLKAMTPPDLLQRPVGEAEVILSQRSLKARCDRLITWLKKNASPTQFPVEFIRIEAVLPRPEEKAWQKADAAEAEPDQSPKAKLKFRLMAEVGATCQNCEKPYLERARRGPKSKRDDNFCQCSKPNLRGPCAYCGKESAARDLQIEHIYPKNPLNIEGGIGPDAQTNKTVACDKCNQADKKYRLPFDYFRTVVGGDAWETWKARVKSFDWPAIKKKIALLEEYRLPEEMGDISQSGTRLVHRYLRQKLSEIYFPDLVSALKHSRATRELKILLRHRGNELLVIAQGAEISRELKEAKLKPELDWRVSTPAGWMTRTCRNDWEYETANGGIVPLVPRKSHLPTPKERKQLEAKRLKEELELGDGNDLGEALRGAENLRKQGRLNEAKFEDIRRGHRARAQIEEVLCRDENVAVCNRTNLNHHWIDAAVLASLPPQANQPVELGGVWKRENREVHADKSLAPHAANYLRKNGDGSVIVDLQNRSARFTARQQETSLYGQFKPLDRAKENEEPISKKIPKTLHIEAAKLAPEIFELGGNTLRLREGVKLNYTQRQALLLGIGNEQLRGKVRAMFKEAFELVECHIIYEPIQNLKVKDKDWIVSDYWRREFCRLCEAEYDFPKKQKESEEPGESGSAEDAQIERRKPTEDQSLPVEAWEKWADAETARLRRTGRIAPDDVVKPPRHLRIYFKLGANEKVSIVHTQPRTTKRGILKPERICRMTSVGSHAVFDGSTGMLKVSLNPWKAHVEGSKQPEPNNEKIFKGDCIWLPHGKIPKGKKEPVSGPGWYRITEMSPAKTKLDGEIEDAKLKLVPAWLDLNQLVRDRQKREPDEAKRKKIKRDNWEIDIHAAELNALYKSGKLRLKHKIDIVLNIKG